jgi:UDP-N-acetylglucosamine 2-epimerase (non-hydrolysing)
MDIVREQFPDVPEERVISTPFPNGTASCVLIALDVLARQGVDPDETLLFMPADHAIVDTAGFARTIKAAAITSKEHDSIALLGILPTYASTEFGYIKRSEAVGGAYKVDSFKEKPDLVKAQEYLKSGDYVWNSGYFIGSSAVIEKKIRETDPNLSKELDSLKSISSYPTHEYFEEYSKFLNVSFDVALLEKLNDLYYVVADFDWADVGTHKDLHDVLTKEKIKSTDKKTVHIVIIATKPDIIKQAPLYSELIRRGEFVLLCHTGQHFDYRYSDGVLEEFGMEVGANLGITGTVGERAAQCIERFSKILEYIKECGKIAVPYIHGDTFAAMAIGTASIINRVACVHVEAGLRTLTPKAAVYQKHYDAYLAGTFSFDEYYRDIKLRENYDIGSMEPFPEQVDTRIAETATGYHAAPVELDREFLLAEGFLERNIEVVGNSVVDSVQASLAEIEAGKSTILDELPLLKTKEFIPVIIHRRETTESAERMAIVMQMLRKMLEEEGLKIYLVCLNGFMTALTNFGYWDEVQSWKEKYEGRFLTTPAITFHRDVINLSINSPTMVIDSGSQQEELNILGVPVATLRFGSDRAETFLSGANVPVPPIDAGFMIEIIKGTINNEEMKAVKNLYGENVSAKIVDGVLARLDPELGLFMTEERRLGLKL